MTNGYEVIVALTSSDLPASERDRIFKDFAQLLGWEPSDRIEPDAQLREVTNGHLIVEHGLDYSAVITFLKVPAAALHPEQETRILSISYNNLVDWHVYVENGRVTYVFNRHYQLDPIIRPITRANLDYVKGTLFDQVTGRAPNPNFPMLDDALVETIAGWKRSIAADLNGKPSLADYSTLFNAIIFVRAAEDHAARHNGRPSRLLLSDWIDERSSTGTLRRGIERALSALSRNQLPSTFLNLERLRAFDALDPGTVYDLFASFYKSRRVPYGYDFAVMSKHALSRIYEHYVSLLRFTDDGEDQLSFLPRIPKEESPKSYGSVYTPQFVARFFSRFLREQLPPSRFRQLKSIDPACGSGIFLRTQLELQYSSSYEGLPSAAIQELFSRVTGIDNDPNATQATILSLSLLYLVLMGGELPHSLNVITGDALEFLQTSQEGRGSFDAVLANPPFVAADFQSENTKKKVARYMGELAVGKMDLYLPFLRLSLDLLKPGGYGLFVLPHTFLSNTSVERLRARIFESAWIRCLVDLSAIPVFEERGTYVILLIFQKKAEPSTFVSAPSATVIRCQDLVGHALQDYLAGKRVETTFYSIYDVDQDAFSDSKEWLVLRPTEAALKRKLDAFKPLREFLQVRQGIVTGADDVFIVRRDDVPKGEEKVWAPLLRDRDMQRWAVPKASNYYIFYPIVQGKKLNQGEIESSYPATWKHLLANADKLRTRRSADTATWWEPSRPRDPDELFRPKLLTPHLVILPRFSLDLQGKYAISRAPYLYPKASESDLDILKFYLAVLNSTVGAWLLSTHSAKYSRGYARLEVRSLGLIPVPDPAIVQPGDLAAIVRMVNEKLEGNRNQQLDRQIDEAVSDIYGLTHSEQLLLGFEGYYAEGNVT
jgi:transposase